MSLALNNWAQGFKHHYDHADCKENQYAFMGGNSVKSIFSSPLTPGRPADIGLQLGKACYPCSR